MVRSLLLKGQWRGRQESNLHFRRRERLRLGSRAHPRSPQSPLRSWLKRRPQKSMDDEGIELYALCAPTDRVALGAEPKPVTRQFIVQLCEEES